MSKPVCNVTVFLDTGKIEVGSGDSIWTTYYSQDHKFDDGASVRMIPLSVFDELVHAEELGYEIEICEVDHENH